MAQHGAFDHLKSTFFDECAELLEQAYEHLRAIQEGRSDRDTIHALFRAIHSIKGGGGAFGFDRLVAFAHQLEAVLDRRRDSVTEMSSGTLRLLLHALDVLSDLAASARAGTEAEPGIEDETLEELRHVAAEGSALPPQTPPPPPTSMREGPAPTQRYRISFAPATKMYRSANEPLFIIRELRCLGSLAVEADLSRLPELAGFDPHAAYLAWTMVLTTAAPRSAIEEAFDFVADDSALSITAEPEPTGGGAPCVRSDRLRPAARALPAEPATAGVGDAHASIRVDVEKVDRLVNLVGELVINQAMLAQVSADLPPERCASLLSGLATMSQHLRELQEGVMGMRAQPVRSVFARMSRLLRELSGQLGKEVRLIAAGEATEIDKAVIEQLADPLTHLLRNALDHGIEGPDEREASGKPRQGVVHLSAAHRGGRIVIEIADDGRGIARDKVLAKAIARGLIAADAVLSDDEIHQLIFLPGFSTADKVSDVSGRGVGMDVVKRNIQALGGRIAIESTPGSGARFLLSLPLTLAILDGMAVAVGEETYIIPIANVIESLRPKPESLHAITGRGDVVAIRGEYVPLVHLHRDFRVPGAVDDPCQGIVVIVESEGARRVGIVVDELIGQLQVVVKSLEANYGPVGGVGGATILGDGRVALILDVNRLQDSSCAPPQDRPAVPTGRGPDLNERQRTAT